MAAQRACVSRGTPAGERVEIIRSGGRPNGLAIDGDGCFWVAGSPARCIGRFSPQGELLMVVDGGETPFIYPNDLAFGPDGLLYMTDTGWSPDSLVHVPGQPIDFESFHYEGAVAQIDPRDGKLLRRLASGIRFTNGVAFGPDGELYFNETLTGLIYRQPLHGPAEPYANVNAGRPPGPHLKGPDGMAFAADGTLYCAVFGDSCVAVVPAGGGQVTERIVVDGNRPTNVAFAEDGSGDIFVTEVQKGVILRIPVGRAGVPLPKPRLGRRP
jgi:gluconolactonase